MRYLNKMIREERNAPKEYKQLEKHLHPKDKKFVEKIIKQEKKHYKTLNKIARNY